jgi:nitroimidazol reductase NimA-like FMN-containing flavoprotein (pyridoxamine 5'-phosphate oxidase superfamily)
MIGSLTNDQIEHVLRNGLIGRIACYADYKIYVVPVTYVFDGKFIYAHSREGMKVQMMRKNPNVCFEVDSIETMINWRCVVAWGKFEELDNETERSKALKILNDRLMPYLLSETMRPHGLAHGPERVEKDRKPVVYRINVTEMSGRYEKNPLGNLPQ